MKRLVILGNIDEMISYLQARRQPRHGKAAPGCPGQAPWSSWHGMTPGDHAAQDSGERGDAEGRTGDDAEGITRNVTGTRKRRPNSPG
ncbi:MAG: hypothetical protein MZU79_08985 [Anaerotruncus sp.]|nr:hypothetical protein [Anaerotruncus sp.]